MYLGIAVRWTFTLMGLLALGCSAPHDNPLDPASDRYRPATSPAALSGSVRSVHVSRNFPSTDTYSVVAELGGNDAMLQDSAWVSFAGRTPVALSRTSAFAWATVFAASYFFADDPHLGSVIGLPFDFSALDQDGNRHTVEPVYLFRVIEGVPRVLEPDSLDITGSHPVLAWEPFSSGFRPFYYRPAVHMEAEGFQFIVWTAPLLPDTVLQIQIPDSLADGQYYWTVTVLDTFQNSSRSKEGLFLVQAESSPDPL